MRTSGARLEGLPGMAWEADPQGRLVSLNRAAARLFGPAGSKLWSATIHPEDRGRCEEMFDSARSARQGFRAIYRRSGRNGSQIWLLDTAAPSLTPRGRLTRFTGVATDITDFKNAETEMRAFNDRLRRSNRDLDEVARAASHDLKEPLSIVSVYSELLQRRVGDRLDPEAAKFVRLTLEAVQRMHALLNDLVSFLKVARVSDSEAHPVDAEAVMTATLMQLKPVMEEAGAGITHDPLPVVLAQEGDLTLMFQGLLDNALKFHGELPPRVHVGCERQGTDAVFHVKDNGIGIDTRYRDQVFGVFRRLHGYDYPGTGIGLALCAKIAEKYGGRIWAESEPGQGSVFHFTLPLAPGHDRGKTLALAGTECGTSGNDEDQRSTLKRRDSRG
ncbi:MAG: ATP-binding protein [Candidatus Polarisedimenticolia bacterium]